MPPAMLGPQVSCPLEEAALSTQQVWAGCWETGLPWLGWGHRSHTPRRKATAQAGLWPVSGFWQRVSPHEVFLFPFWLLSPTSVRNQCLSVWWCPDESPTLRNPAGGLHVNSHGQVDTQ